MLAIKVALHAYEVDNKQERKGESHSAAREFWRKRIGTFQSNEDFIISIQKARKNISMIPKRRTLGLDWRELGPDNIGGRTRAILIDNENPNLMFAGGVAGGLWFSLDAGLTWIQTSPGDIAEVLTVNCIEQDELGYVYYGTGEGVFYGDIIDGDENVAPGTIGFGYRGHGVFRSIEPHGTTFMHLENSWIGKEVNTVAINAISSDDHGNLYAGAKEKLYRSKDHGVTWFDVNYTTNNQTIKGDVYDVKAFSDGSVLLAMGNEYYLSPNGDADSFIKISSPSGVLTPATGRSVFAIAPSDENVVYMSRSDKDDFFDGLFKSIDKGSTWIKIIGGGSDVFTPFKGGGGQGNYNQCLAVFPDNPNKILLGGIEIYEWEEGKNWKKLSKWNGSWSDDNYVHADAHTFSFHPSNPNQYYIGTDGGIFMTKDNGEVFQRLNRGFNITQFYGVAFGKDGAVLGGTQDNANIYIDFKGNTEQSGELHNSGDGGYSAISQLMPDAFFSESQFGRIGRDNSRSGSYSEFFYHKDAAINQEDLDYDSRWSEFITPILLWESASDSLIPDSSVFIADKDYFENDVIKINSNISGLSFIDTLNDALFEGDTLLKKVPKQSMFIYGTHQAVYITRNAIDFSANVKWFELTRAGCFYHQNNTGFGPSCVATSNDGDIIYYGTDRGEVYRISNVSKVVSDETVDSVLVVKIASVFKSATSENGYISDITVDPNDKEHVIYTVGFYNQTTNVYESKTAASTSDDQSFSSIAGNLPEIPVYTVMIEESSGAYIIGTEYGLFSSVDNGTSWFQELEGPPQCPVTFIRQQTFNGSENRGQIYVATHGRGLFTTEGYLTSSHHIDKAVELDDKTLKIYPNPVESILNFDVDITNGEEFMLQIMDSKGKIVLVKNQKTKKVNVSSLTLGSYILSIQKEQINCSATFIKN